MNQRKTVEKQPPVLNKLLVISEQPSSRKQIGRRPLSRKKFATQNTCKISLKKSILLAFEATQNKATKLIKNQPKPLRPNKTFKQRNENQGKYTSGLLISEITEKKNNLHLR